MVQKQFDKVNSLGRDSLIHPATVCKSKRQVTPFVLDYNPNLPEIGKIIRNNLHILHSTPLIQEIFPDRSIIPAFRRPENLKELLAPSKLRSRTRTHIHQGGVTLGCFKCHSKCDLCRNYFTKSSSFTSFITGKTYQIKELLSCESHNVIYLASCNKCRLQYVGSTTNNFKIRFRNHKSHCKNNRRTCELSKHFNDSPHVLSDFSYICIEALTHVLSNIEVALTNREAYWISQLFTQAPYGLNKRDEQKS